MSRWPNKIPPPPKLCEYCGNTFERKRGSDYASFSKRRFCSPKCSNLRPNSGRRQLGQEPWNKGKICPQLVISEQSRVKKSASLKAVGAGKWRKGMEPWNKGKKNPYFAGENNPNWKGGATVKIRGLRWSSEYAQWRRAVFERDNYTCQFCGQRGGRLNADHIKPLLYHPELMFELSNGRTLCEPCHKKTDTYGTKVKSWREPQCA